MENVHTDDITDDHTGKYSSQPHVTKTSCGGTARLIHHNEAASYDPFNQAFMACPD